MAILGIDGNQWYVIDGCLGDPRTSVVFADTAKQAIDEWNLKTRNDYLPPEKFPFPLEWTPEQYEASLKPTPTAPKE